MSPGGILGSGGDTAVCRSVACHGAASAAAVASRLACTCQDRRTRSRVEDAAAPCGATWASSTSALDVGLVHRSLLQMIEYNLILKAFTHTHVGKHVLEIVANIFETLIIYRYVD